jgi:hypothetical protein
MASSKAGARCFRMAHDDQVDAMTQALLRWSVPMQEKHVVFYNNQYTISPY